MLHIFYFQAQGNMKNFHEGKTFPSHIQNHHQFRQLNY